MKTVLFVNFHHSPISMRMLDGVFRYAHEAKWNVQVAGPGDPLGYRVEYRVFDLETGDVTDLTRRDIYDHPELYGTVITNYADVGAGFAKPADLPAEDVFIATGFNENDMWKTTKLVMKRIPAKDVVWWMGPCENDPNTLAAGSVSSVTGGKRLGESRFQATFTDDYYIGIFELTQKQFSLLMDGANPSFYSNATYWATRPVENYSFNDIKDTFVPAARAALGKQVNTPSEAQWEFAAKAMYDGPGYPHGLELSKDNYVTVEGMVNGASDNGRYSVGNGESPVGSGSGTLTVGSGKPNPFGIYNMFGNVSEFVSELYANKNLGELYATQIAQGPVSDPYCSTSQSIGGSTSYRIIKGCNFRIGSPDYRNRSACRLAVKNNVVSMGNESDHVLGFRLACPAD